MHSYGSCPVCHCPVSLEDCETNQCSWCKASLGQEKLDQEKEETKALNEPVFYLVYLSPPGKLHGGKFPTEAEAKKKALLNCKPKGKAFVLKAIGLAIAGDVRYEEIDDLPF